MKNRRNKEISLSVPEKTTRILGIIMCCMILIVLRIWHLTEVQHEERLEEAVKPRKRIVMEPAKRGTIRDRFNIPLAINRVQYEAGVVYGEIRHVPAVKWVTLENGKRVKKYVRKEYIHDLAEMIGNVLSMDSRRIEDLIHSKATFYFQLPFILKQDISEEQYYRLNMLVKDWPGLYVQRVPRRFYPKNKTAADVIGYMGAINKEEYEHILEELKFLRDYVRAEEEGEALPLPEGYSSMEKIYKRLKDLEDQAYTANDLVGKGGIEQQFESLLRGYHGKKIYYSDARGNFLRELPGSRPPLSGQRVLLTLSAELQEYAEQLLATNEKIRKMRVAKGGKVEDPWIKGGAIVVMEPNSGELLALASFPRFDPNDFVSNDRQEVNHWFETDNYIADLWDAKRPMEREIFALNKGVFEVEKQKLDWDIYLNIILPEDSAIRSTIKQLGTVKNVIKLQHHIKRLLALSGQNNLQRLINVLYQEEHFQHGSPPPAHIRAAIIKNLNENEDEVSKIQRQLEPWFESLSHNYDKLLLIDLCRLAVDGNMESELLNFIGNMSLNEYHSVNAAYLEIREAVRDIVKEEFRVSYFFPWREQYGAEYLKDKRAEEKIRKTWARPYLDYFDKKEAELFKEFWENYQNRFVSLFVMGSSAVAKLTDYDTIILSWFQELAKGAHASIKWRKSYDEIQKAIASLTPKQTSALFKSFRGFQDLTAPLYGNYRYLRKEGKQQQLKHLAAAFYPVYGYGNARSFAYRQATTQGSLFKLVTAYAAMIQKYRQVDDASLTFSDLNPLTIIDKVYKNNGKQYVGQLPSGKPIPLFYKGGRMMRSVARDIGKIDILGALETSSNPYFSLIAGEYLEDPMDLARTAHLFSYGSKTGIELPSELKGKVPDDLDINRTGLYAMANGQHTLVVTPLQSSVMLSAIANGGYIVQPKIVSLTAGHVPDRGQELKHWRVDFPFKKQLALVGIDFPLFVNSLQKQQQQVNKWPTQILGKVEMPHLIRNMLLEGMRRVTNRLADRGLGGLSQLYKNFPGAVSTFVELKDEIIGKTSTSESMENINLDLYRGTQMFNHVWFGGIVYDKEVDPKGFLARDQKGNPELVVVVFLRYGAFGKEAAPLAAQVVSKWREIKARHQ